VVTNSTKEKEMQSCLPKESNHESKNKKKNLKKKGKIMKWKGT